ncbi:MAG: 16S rRNA (cytosine(1402)-N(4))-methyltransferase RsmH [Clostridia bacterium]|nr:16S rRNA (cytosine(1402)-N(4))-methyltransferase RsmH [Clostridia bacterium]
MEFRHVSILLNECIEGLAISPNGTYVDATMGGAGHSRHICSHLSAQGKFIGVDRDEEAFTVAKERLEDAICEKQFIRSDFRNIGDYVTEPVDGILADLGVSSYQLDNKDRGFSYREDAVLDMRMDRSSPLSAKTVVNTYSLQQLAYIISTYGEEKFARSIAANIVKQRELKPIETTGELIEIIRRSMPQKSLREKHPAKRTFQAIRIEVNSELDSLKQGLESFFSLLKPGGRMCIITFHSLEDRIVKEYFKSLVNVCTCPPEFPVCVCNKKTLAKIITKKPILPSEQEMEENPRSKSAKLRILEKL